MKSAQATVTTTVGALLVTLLLGAAFAATAHAQPRGDCHKSSQWSDMMVCGNPNLTDLDAQVDAAYRKQRDALPAQDAEQVRLVQEQWLRGREKCQEDADPMKCLETYYQRHIKELFQSGQ